MYERDIYMYAYVYIYITKESNMGWLKIWHKREP